MKTITVPAKRNGSHIDPVNPVEIPENAKLFILIATPETVEDQDEDFRVDWYALSTRGLSRAYGDQEPDYSDAMIKEPNSEYGKR
ncbi:MAG: hypothetical protein SFU53_14970 [Terrimicrobiaceae bacterium]|nr:hypothetical protein [Terrimicrobiaceae bacterium]